MDLSITQWIYLVAMVAWVLCTLLWQFPKIRENAPLLSRINVLGIFPIWTFFSPNPGIFDVHVIYRDKDVYDTISEWKEMEILFPRQFIHGFWNPRKRNVKLIIDAVSDVKTVLGKYRGDDDLNSRIMLTKGFLVLLQGVSAMPKLLDAKHVIRQFAIINSTNINGHRTIVPIYESQYFSI